MRARTAATRSAHAGFVTPTAVRTWRRPRTTKSPAKANGSTSVTAPPAAVAKLRGRSASAVDQRLDVGSGGCDAAGRIGHIGRDITNVERPEAGKTSGRRAERPTASNRQQPKPSGPVAWAPAG